MIFMTADKKIKKGWKVFGLVIFGIFIFIAGAKTANQLYYNNGFQDGRASAISDEDYNYWYMASYDAGFTDGFEKSDYKDEFFRAYYKESCVDSMCRESQQLWDEECDRNSTISYCTLLLANYTTKEYMEELYGEIDIERVINESLLYIPSFE